MLPGAHGVRLRAASPASSPRSSAPRPRPFTREHIHHRLWALRAQRGFSLVKGHSPGLWRYSPVGRHTQLPSPRALRLPCISAHSGGVCGAGWGLGLCWLQRAGLGRSSLREEGSVVREDRSKEGFPEQKCRQSSSCKELTGRLVGWSPGASRSWCERTLGLGEGCPCTLS